MKGTLFALGFLLLLVPALAGCGVSITGSGNVVTQEFDLADFDKVDVSHGFTAEITSGEAFSVVMHVDDNLVEYLEVVKRGSTLKIGLKPLRSYTLRNATLEAEVTMPELTGLDLSGGSHCNISGFKSTKALDADLSGGSHLRGDVEAGNASFDVSGGSHVTLSGSAQDLTIDASGGSHVTLSGSAQDLTIDASGGSHVNLADFSVADANVEASGGSEATVNPGGRLDADASGGSRVYYLGSPTLGTIDTDGSSSVKQK